MFYGDFSDAKIVANPKFKVVGKNITLETKLVDSGMKGTLYITHPVMIMYFIKYCQTNTKHIVKGKYDLHLITYCNG